MATGNTTAARHIRSSRFHRLAGLGSAVALSVLLTGNVAAYQLDRDDGGTVPLVTPRLETPNVTIEWLAFKLATTAGHKILVYG